MRNPQKMRVALESDQEKSGRRLSGEGKLLKKPSREKAATRMTEIPGRKSGERVEMKAGQ